MPKWTDAQLKAIETRGEDLLVSAAAGSGKTAVLSARVGTFVEGGGSLDRLLIATFTKAAAAEMRSRIARDLAKRAAENPKDAHLRKQSLTLYKAKIGTIDSFGMDLLRRHFHTAGLAPDFSVMDETEREVLEKTVLSRQMEEYYTQFPPGFGEFLELFGGDTDSEELESTVRLVNRKMSVLPFAERWLERQKERFSGSEEWCREICRILIPIFADYSAIMKEVLAARPFSDKGMETVEADCRLTEEILTALQEERWAEASKLGRTALFGRAPAVKQGMPREAFLYKEYRGRLKKELAKESYWLTPEQCEKDLGRQRTGMLFLFDAVLAFREEMSREMGRKGVYTFDALADRALRILIRDYDHETGKYQLTAAAKEEQERYDEILIDEYQDVNDIQDLLFRAVSKNNCFAVGDVKQSIYGFRGSNAENFLRKKEECTVIDLNKNFRSRKGVLDAVNFLCKGLFTKEIGGLAYDEKETLYPGRNPDEGRPYPEGYEATLPPAGDDTLPPPASRNPEPDTELLLLTGEGSAEELRQNQAVLCAKLIRDAVEGGATVYDKQTETCRPLRYSDVAVLVRTGKHFDLYEKAFRAWGIPLLSGGGGSFLTTPEVYGITEFLRTVNDPWDDLPLFVTLTGSIFSLSPETVAKFRLCAPKRSLWEGMTEAAKTDEEAAFALKEIKKFRILAENLPIAKLIWEIYARTDYPALESAADPAARSNLMKFYAFARRYSRSDGLFGFLEFVDRARESGNIKEAEGAPEGDFVRLMTIHGSKGLEYAWCILPELNGRFKKDRDNVQVDPVFGVAPRIRNEEQTAKFTTLMREVIYERSDLARISEELRGLYVALTRARDRMTLIVPCPKPEQIDLSGLHSRDGAVRYLDRKEAADYRSLLLDRAVLHPEAKAIHTSYQPPETGETEGFRVAFVGVPETVTPISEGEKARCGLSEEELKRRFSYRYDGHLSTVPAKVSVTEIAKAPADPDSELLIRESPAAKPKFLDETALTAAEAGTAIHTFCQFAEFDRPVEEEIARLTAAGHLTEAAAKALDRKQIQRLLESDLMTFLRNALGYQREVRFTCRIPVSYYSGNPGEEGEMLMQGAIDLLCETEEGYWIIDFKSDRASEEELQRRYSRQLNLYAAAVRRLYDKPVLGCKIWAFRLGKAIDVKEEDL